ncbi:hypothetical protein EJB05_09094, partial [Eragrostis curvula]
MQLTALRCVVEADVERAVARHGRLDVFYNNAAASVHWRQTRAAKHTASMDVAKFVRVLLVNALGAALGMKHAVRTMVAHGGGGSIVLVASVAGAMGGMGSPFGMATPMLVNAWRNQQQDEEEAFASQEENSEEVVRGLATLKGVTLRARDIAEAALFLASSHNLVVDGRATTSRNVIGL